MGLLALPGSFELSEAALLARTLPVSGALARSAAAREMPSARLPAWPVQPHLAPRPARSALWSTGELRWPGRRWLQKGCCPK